MPRKRGAKYGKRRFDLNIEEDVRSLRELGNNRYEIKAILKQDKGIEISASSVYNICRRLGLNRLKKAHKSEKRKILMSRIGELVHIDCHTLSEGLTIDDGGKKFYLLGLIDDYSRLAWVEILDDKKALTVMFAALKSFNMLRLRYGLEIDAVMTDNGAEFGSGVNKNNKLEHPFERLLLEMQMGHKYTKPYRPQTNGKIERFWKTLKEDFLEGALYQNKEDLHNELLAYLVYYNEHRPHSAINNMTPKAKAGA